ncbi:MAG: OsmC family protein [Gemmatimonadota bacterium]|nr:OsmC family protein [Gemmatimonadota bacterium]
MLGTLNGALEVRGISLPPDAIRADVTGLNEVRDRLPVLTRIAIHYTLRIPAGSRDTLDRALTTHQAKCPTAASLREAIEITWTADVEERE